jgi:hypothetical protein
MRLIVSERLGWTFGLAKPHLNPLTPLSSMVVCANSLPQSPYNFELYEHDFDN